MKKNNPPQIWQSLHRSHQRVLKVIFDIDQEKERHDRELGAQGCYSKPRASDWRWIWLRPIFGYQESITILPRARMARLSKDIDEALKFLEKSGLLEYRVELVNNGQGKIRMPQYKLTRLGRAVAREGTGKQQKKRLPPGTLREWHWKALELAYHADEKGLVSETGRYGGISWHIWSYLQNHKLGKLVEEFGGEVWDYTNRDRLHTVVINRRLRITAVGKTFFEENFKNH